MPYNSDEEWVEPEHNRIEPVWDEYAAAVHDVEQYGLQLPNNAGRLDAIRNWRQGLCGGPAKNRYAELSSGTREGVIATVEAVWSTLHNTPANANLVLPTMSMVFPKTPRRQATVTRDSRSRNKRKPRDEPSSTSLGEENVYHHQGMPQPDLSLFPTDHLGYPLPTGYGTVVPTMPYAMGNQQSFLHPEAPQTAVDPRLYAPLDPSLGGFNAYAPAPVPSAPPSQHPGYYQPGTYPSNPVLFNRPHDPSAPPPDAYKHARLARTNPAPEGDGHSMHALGRRAARHYGTTPERWARGGAW